MLLLSQASKQGLFGASKPVEQMQKVVSNLTVMLSERDEEVSAL